MNDPSETDPIRGDAHYRDARYYDHAYQRYKPDIDVYVEHARALGGRVLELGGGTGRVAIPMARAGVEVVLVDRMQSMLDRAKERLSRETKAVRDRVRLVRADIRVLSLGETFSLVIAPFNVFQHLYTRADIERALHTARTHLEEDGQLFFDVMLPDPDSLARDPLRFFKHRPIVHPRDGRRYAYSEAFEYNDETQIQTTVIRFEALDDGEEVYDQLVQRQFFPRELEALLHYNGFEVLRHDGGFRGEPLDSSSESQVILARPRPT